MNRETFKLYKEIEEELALIDDGDIKKLGYAILEMADNYILKCQELDKKNKIIQELEKWLNSKINNISLQVPYSCNPTLGQSIYQDVLKKIKELKR